MAWAAGPYEGIVRELAVALKFGRMVMLADCIAEAMVAAAPAGLVRGVIVPVPPSPRRRRRRGFDPAGRIAAALARIEHRTVADCLTRTEGPEQVGRARRERTCDPPRVRARGDVPGQVTLVDDVHTTGATLGACARALRRGGAVEVVAVTFARAA
jgi:predicted amidophosphoribosyltransferase